MEDMFCSQSENKCAVDTYCPATSSEKVACIACSSSTPAQNSCNCQFGQPSPGCKICFSKHCTTCHPGYFLNGTACTKCPAECSVCTSLNACSACKSGFEVKGEKCEPICTENSQCTDGKFCNKETKECQPCKNGCLICASSSFCGACPVNQYADINGKCHPNCTDLKDGEYCKDGVKAACGEGLTSQCTCGFKNNCGSCNEAKDGCATCLSGFQLTGTGCNQCMVDFESLGQICYKPGTEGNSDDNKLSGGAIAGIVIGSIVIIGGVFGGLAYYFIKKNKRLSQVKQVYTGRQQGKN